MSCTPRTMPATGRSVIRASAAPIPTESTAATGSAARNVYRTRRARRTKLREYIVTCE